MLLVALLTAVLLLAFTIPRVYSAFEGQAYGALESAARALAVGIFGTATPDTAGAGDTAASATAATETTLRAARTALRPMRVTWVAPDGAVLYDSGADAATMENHADRAEVREALAADEGHDSRLSETLGEKTYYYALRLPDGTVLRLAESRRSVAGVAMGLVPSLIVILLLALAIAVFTADGLTVRLIKPVVAIDLDRPDENDVYEELTPLLGRLAAQNDRIAAQMRAMDEHTRSFDTITRNMSEGLVVLGKDGVVLSVNQSAVRLFGVTGARAATPHYPAGSHYLVLDRDLVMRDAVERALSGSTAEAKLTRGGRVYQLLANPVLDGGAAGGAILLLLDITERERAEEARREFSANVSHELKTPLTSIAGYAEMLAAGMVRPEDTSEAAGKIHREALRLITLIEDILALSRLDERKAPAEKEAVALLSLADEVLSRLAPAANKAQVTLAAEGEDLAVTGVRSVLEEMLFNLVENGVKYNRAGGQVRVTVARADDGGVAVTVADTGVGIAPEHQEKVFERFYRVDKSHSRSTGGTGLGLSIVKHGAILHGARVALSSRVGEGTEITVTF